MRGDVTMAKKKKKKTKFKVSFKEKDTLDEMVVVKIPRRHAEEFSRELRKSIKPGYYADKNKVQQFIVDVVKLLDNRW
jgi:hypothetical protein